MHHRSFFRSILLSQRLNIAASAVAIAAALTLAPCRVVAQAEHASSSADYAALLDADAAASPLASPSPQYGQRSRPPYAYRDRFNHFAVEAGGGFTAPAGNTQRDLKYGYNFTGGVGYKFARDFSLMAEYQFVRNGISDAVLAAVQEPGGNVHTWSLTLAPVLYYKTSGTWGGYITGGGGFYRKLTSFTEPTTAIGEYCDYFSCYPYEYNTNVVVSHYSSNQGGANLGTGITFGRWSGAKVFAEARYTWLNTPGRGTQLIPVTLGLRW